MPAMTRAPLAIWGAAGHARAVTTVARLDDRWQIVGYIDDVDAGRADEPFCGSSVIGGREALDGLRRRGVRHLFLAFGANAARLALADELQRAGFEFPSLVHPSRPASGNNRSSTAAPSSNTTFNWAARFTSARERALQARCGSAIACGSAPGR
jgi:hypothetical protein